MEKARIIADVSILDKITNSTKMGDIEKLNFLKYIWYMTEQERQELSLII